MHALYVFHANTKSNDSCLVRHCID